LLHTILPGGETILHKLAGKGDIIENLMIKAHPIVENENVIKFHMPFICYERKSKSGETE
jgi:hypothetical protein